MEAPTALKKLASNYNVHLYHSDRKFYRKYTNKVEIHLSTNAMSESMELIHNLRTQAQNLGDQVRRERWTLNYYTNNLDTIEDIIGQANEDGSRVFQILWFPPDVEKNIILRQNPVEWKWGVKVGQGASKERLREFVDRNKQNVNLDRAAKHELYPGPIRYGVRRPNTWGYCLFRFKDEDLKNYFVFSFAESVMQETTYLQRSEVQNEQ